MLEEIKGFALRGDLVHRVRHHPAFDLSIAVDDLNAVLARMHAADVPVGFGIAA